MLVLGGTWDGRSVDWPWEERGPAMRVPMPINRAVYDLGLGIEPYAIETYCVERMMVDGKPHWFLVHSSLRGSGTNGGISATEIMSLLYSYYRKPLPCPECKQVPLSCPYCGWSP